MTSTTTSGTTALHYPIHNMLRAKITHKENVNINGGIIVTFDILNGEDENNPEVLATNQKVEAAPDAVANLIKERLVAINDARVAADDISIGQEITL